MITKQKASSKKKDGEITRSERSSATQLAEARLKEIKKNTKDVILVPISDRTTLELPADLTQDEIEARIDKFRKFHKLKV